MAPVDLAVLRSDLDRVGFSVHRSVVPTSLVEPLRTETDVAVQTEVTRFGPGDPQFGRLLFAPAHGGSFLDLLALDPLLAPMEALLGDDAIVYTYTSSCVPPNGCGPVTDFHDDFDPLRSSRRLGLVALVALDEFTEASGATEFLAGSHTRSRSADRLGTAMRLTAAPGDVCYFDPRVLHRSTLNRTPRWRRALLIMMVEPWIKQRVDVAAMLGGTSPLECPPRVVRRLGLDALPPGSIDEFVARRRHRPVDAPI